MSGSNSISTALSEAEKRTVKITSTNGDPIIYDGNPASLAGVRYETDKCLERLGAFELLVQHNSSRLANGTIATEDPSSILKGIGSLKGLNFVVRQWSDWTLTGEGCISFSV